MIAAVFGHTAQVVASSGDSLIVEDMRVEWIF
jgi:hypothetical protein